MSMMAVMSGGSGANAEPLVIAVSGGGMPFEGTPRELKYSEYSVALIKRDMEVAGQA
jgi:hypothetical protein